MAWNDDLVANGPRAIFRHGGDLKSIIPRAPSPDLIPLEIAWVSDGATLILL